MAANTIEVYVVAGETRFTADCEFVKDKDEVGMVIRPKENHGDVFSVLRFADGNAFFSAVDNLLDTEETEHLKSQNLEQS